MQVPRIFLSLVGFACLMYGQYAPPPDAYSLTEVDAMMGVAATMEVFRDGSKAVVDMNYPPGGTRPNGAHTRTLYDLQAGISHTWSLAEASSPCSAARVKGDWGDPFKTSAAMNAQIAKQEPKSAGTENISGIATKVVEAELPNGGTAKLWVEPKYGLLMKVEMTGEDGKTKTLLSVKELKLEKPAASMFTLPAACSAVAPPPPRAPSGKGK